MKDRISMDSIIEKSFKATLEQSLPMPENETKDFFYRMGFMQGYRLAEKVKNGEVERIEHGE